MRSLVLLLLSCTPFAFAQTTLPIWPKLSNAVAVQESDTTKPTDDLVAGRRVIRLTGVTNPTVTFFPAPPAKNSGTAIVVFPGGGYRILAFDLEGTEVCTWLNSVGVSCLVLKYRVPDAGPYPTHSEDLADARRAVRLARSRAAEWKLNPDHIGVLGFSAGGHLAAALSNNSDEKAYPAGDTADQLSAKPNFALMIYPGGLLQSPERTQLRSEVMPSSSTPPTFLVQAENDPVHVENTLVYYNALTQAKVPAEMHIFAQGGHGYGLRKTELPITNWPQFAAEWLRTINMLGAPRKESRP